jgi:hypothetical protein
MITGSPRTLKYKSRREKRRRKKLESGEQPERVRACRSLDLRTSRASIILYTRGRASAAKVQLNPLLLHSLRPLPGAPAANYPRAPRNYTCVCFCAQRMAPKVQGLLIRADLAL